jgi:hypothetical protein
MRVPVGFKGLSIEVNVMVVAQRILWCLIAIAMLLIMDVI